jgi:hypothetical protein
MWKNIIQMQNGLAYNKEDIKLLQLVMNSVLCL